MISGMRGCVLKRNWCVQILLLASEAISTGGIKKGDHQEAFLKLLHKVSYYWYHSDDRFYVGIACWTLATYLHRLFGCFPILHFQGERESGKSTAIHVLHNFAWNPTSPEASLRSADLFRTIEGSRPTYLVDITKFQDRGADIQDVIDVFELGYERNGVVRRCDKDTLEPTEWRICCPKAVASRYDLPFENKAIRIITDRPPKNLEKIYTERHTQLLRGDPDVKTIIGDILRCCLNVWNEILQVHEQLTQTDKLYGRRFEIWSPLLAVCKVFAPDKFGDLLALAEKDAEEQEVTDRIAEVEECLLSVLQKSKTWLLKDLTIEIQERVPWVKSWHIVKSALTNLGVSKGEYQASRGKTYKIDLERVKEKAQNRGIESAEIPKEEEGEEPTAPVKI